MPAHAPAVSDLQKSLEQLETQGLYRQLAPPSSLLAPPLDFTSNDYLGFAHHPAIRQALIEALQEGCALGATGSRLLGGNTLWHERAETFLAHSFGFETALLFNSGYSANTGVLSALGDETTDFFSDEQNHASLIDGMRLTKSQRTVFKHNDIQHLAELLQGSSKSRKVIVTESVFSMDGDLAPLHEMAVLAQEHNAWLVVDEAHATGVFGTNGLGCLHAPNFSHFLSYPRLIAIHTAGKALGAQGAFVLASRTVREFLINRARSFIFSTALTPLTAVHIEAAVRLLLQNPTLGPQLLQKATQFRARVNTFLDTGKSASQIVPVLIPSNSKVLAVAHLLQDQGFGVRAIRSPTVAVGTERLRLTLKHTHTATDLERLATALQKGLAHDY